MGTRPTDGDRLCVADLGLRSAVLQEQVPLGPDDLDAQPALRDLAGHLAESLLYAYLGGPRDLQVSWQPERKDRLEVDLVLTFGTRRVPVEVKYSSRIRLPADIQGLVQFLDRPENEASVGVLVTRDDPPAIADPRIVALPLSSVLMLR